MELHSVASCSCMGIYCGWSDFTAGFLKVIITDLTLVSFMAHCVT